MNPKDNKGFTLIELLIYIALVAGILLTATSFAWNIINSRTKAFVIQEVSQNGRYTMNIIASQIRQASGISKPGVSGSENYLMLKMGDTGASVNDFRLFQDKLQFQENGGGYHDLTSDNVRVADLHFTNVSTVDGRTQNIKINLTLEHINPDNRPEWSYSDDFETTIELRNKAK
ncbi:MAG: prepilin-type N-terminal cleavage/methylation domain-containing protein [Patescibacteria group bacterium]|jgi:prepilin-type N-terminal cleavage/methylation domain-containing protein